jgi:hypothetical protein
MGAHCWAGAVLQLLSWAQLDTWGGEHRSRLDGAGAHHRRARRGADRRTSPAVDATFADPECQCVRSPWFDPDARTATERRHPIPKPPSLVGPPASCRHGAARGQDRPANHSTRSSDRVSPRRGRAGRMPAVPVIRSADAAASTGLRIDWELRPDCLEMALEVFRQSSCQLLNHPFRADFTVVSAFARVPVLGLQRVATGCIVRLQTMPG